MNNQDIRLDLLRKLESNPKLTQRELSREMGVSLGKLNYCMKKLIEKGLIKLLNFSHDQNKMGYAYLLTPQGIEEKSRLTFSFLKSKIVEYEVLKKEINTLKLESQTIESCHRLNKMNRNVE
jgi:EPS-associated MarR family transcriptional regulator